MITLTFEEAPEFKKDFKHLKKKYKTLDGDFARLKKLAISLYHIQKIDNNSCFRIPGYISEKYQIYKVKKFACRSLKGGARSGLRVIYSYSELTNRVIFIEIYYKGDKVMEDKERIISCLKSLEEGKLVVQTGILVSVT